MHTPITFGSNEEALVFFDWLVRFNGSDACDLLAPSERRVLWDLEAALESSLPEVLSDRYVDLLREAQATVAGREESA